MSQVLQITKEKHSNPSSPITIKQTQKQTNEYEMNNISINPQAPNSPMNTPPNIDILRELYLSYLSHMTKQH